MICQTLVVMILLLTPALVRAADTDDLQSVAGKIADLITEKPAGYAPLFSDAFLSAVPEARLTVLLQSMYHDNGTVVHVSLKSHTSGSQGLFTFTYKSMEMPVTLVIDPQQPHQVVGLWFGNAVPLLKSMEEIAAKLAKLPGTVSFQLQRLDDGHVLASLNPDTALAIGSAFKLYILATLVHQNAAWDRVVHLENRYKSLPSGEMHKWPAGAPVTVHTLALKMISISDNTATDHLLALAGRQAVESMLPELGMTNPKANVPFLGTLEMFRIKSDPALLHDYLASDRTGRQHLLEKLLGTTRPALASVNKSLAKPNAIGQVEWFASAADLCRLMRWFDQHGSPTALDILAVNPGFSNPPDKFEYVGFKGGSETGVLNFTWLLRLRSGPRFALSVSWNNPDKAVDQAELMGLMTRAVDLLADDSSR